MTLLPFEAAFIKHWYPYVMWDIVSRTNPLQPDSATFLGIDGTRRYRITLAADVKIRHMVETFCVQRIFGNSVRIYVFNLT